MSSRNPGPSQKGKQKQGRVQSLQPAAPPTTTSTLTGTSNASSLIVENPLPTIPSKNEPRYQPAVHSSTLDESFNTPPKNRANPPEQDITIATNYVAVKKVPAKVYMYSIEFGKTTAVLTPMQKQRIIDAEIANLSLEAEAASGNIRQPVPTQVAQRSEKARILSQLAKRTELHCIQRATDYVHLWTLQPLESTAETVQNIEYTKLSGRSYKLDYIAFKFLRQFALGSGAEASANLVNHDHDAATNEVTAKGASMRVTALNAFISKYASMNDQNVIQVGPNKFFLKDDWKSVDDRTLHIHRGYFTSIRPGQSSVLLNINLATSAFFAPMNVASFLNKARHPSFSAENLLKGLNIRIAYRRHKFDPDYDPNTEENRHRIIAGFGDPPGKQTFDLEGRTITVQDYFLNNLGYAKIEHPTLPCISVNIAPKPPSNGDKNSPKKGETKKDENKASPQWILPELLYLDPYQPFGKLLAPVDTEKMIEVAIRAPADTQDKIVNGAFQLLGIKSPMNPFQDLDLVLGDHLLRIPARRIMPPQIKYRGKNPARINNASWNLTGVHFFASPTNSPVHVYPLQNAVGTIDMRCTTSRHVSSLGSAGFNLSHRMRDHGIAFAGKEIPNQPHLDLYQQIQDWKPPTKPSALCTTQDLGHHGTFQIARAILTDIFSRRARNNLAVVVLSSKEVETYGIIKRVCDQYIGLHTVCVVEEKLRNKKTLKWKDMDDQQLSNLALKFNMKLGGQNHQVCQPYSTTSFFSTIANDTIVFGADVSHAGSSMPFTPSIAAVVASDDTNFANFPASMRLQGSNQEIIAELEDMVYHRLLHFAAKRGFLPKRILFYRDGVGEDQFNACNDEIDQIKRAFTRVVDQAPKLMKEQQKVFKSQVKAEQLELTFIVVGKRHHTRFFCTDKDQTYTMGTRVNGNLKPGVVVDQVITRPPVSKIQDFFLQSHAAIQGTARSGHYSILLPGKFSMHEIQKLTHAFCYNYMRATKGVSYVGPAYYADRLCERGTHYLRGAIGGRKAPPFDQTEEEKSDRVNGAKNFARRVAARLSEMSMWNPNAPNFPNREPNPWHPDFDNCMFWL